MSSATPNEPPVAAKDTNMARLSAPASETPKTDRKSSRFREIFKHRPNSSASSSPTTLTKSPPPVVSSPLPSPDVRPGFQQIGLLPGERSSHSLQRLDENELNHDEKIGSTVAGVLTSGAKKASATRNACHGMDNIGATHPCDAPTLARLKAENRVRKGSSTQSMKSALSKHPVEKADRDIAANGVAMGENVSPQVVGDANKRSSLPLGSSHKIAEAMYHKNNSSVTDGSMDDRESFLALPHVPDSTENSKSDENITPEQYKSLSASETNDALKGGRMSQHIRDSVETANGPGNDATLLDEDGHSSHGKSFESNIFDDNSSLSQGVREYVTSKIAEALAEYDRTHVSEGNTTANPPLRFTIKIDATGLARKQKISGLGVSNGRNDAFTQPSSIGPLKIKSALLARDSQLVVMAIYAVALLSASLLGPKALLLTIWRMAIMLGMYTAMLRQLGWTENIERDVFLVPVFFAASVATGMGEQLLEQMRLVMVTVLVAVFERVAQGTGAHVRTE